jgi:hypothetical protein
MSTFRLRPENLLERLGRGAGMPGLPPLEGIRHFRGGTPCVPPT